MSPVEAVAKAVATIAHKGQVDKAGNPYIGHPARVAESVRHLSHPWIVAAAWLHDVLEDTDITRQDLEAAGLPDDVTSAVEILTRNDEQSPEEYYEAIRYAKAGVLSIKLADIDDNTDPSRLALLDDATIIRLTRKYAKARLLLGVSS